MWRVTPLLVLAACVACSSLHHTYTLQGSITAPKCDGGYAIEHTAVTVKDERGIVIGSTTTGADVTADVVTPVPDAIMQLPVSDPQRKAAIETHGQAIVSQCIAQFTLSVPKASFYQVQVGTHGGRPYSFEELQATGFHLDLSLQ